MEYVIIFRMPSIGLHEYLNKTEIHMPSFVKALN